MTSSSGSLWRRRPTPCAKARTSGSDTGGHSAGANDCTNGGAPTAKGPPAAKATRSIRRRGPLAADVSSGPEPGPTVGAIPTPRRRPRPANPQQWTRTSSAHRLADEATGLPRQINTARWPSAGEGVTQDAPKAQPLECCSGRARRGQARRRRHCCQAPARACVPLDHRHLPGRDLLRGDHRRRTTPAGTDDARQRWRRDVFGCGFGEAQRVIESLIRAGQHALARPALAHGEPGADGRHAAVDKRCAGRCIQVRGPAARRQAAVATKSSVGRSSRSRLSSPARTAHPTTCCCHGTYSGREWLSHTGHLTAEWGVVAWIVAFISPRPLSS